jgi:hypothetical protein
MKATIILPVICAFVMLIGVVIYRIGFDGTEIFVLVGAALIGAWYDGLLR